VVAWLVVGGGGSERGAGTRWRVQQSLEEAPDIGSHLCHSALRAYAMPRLPQPNRVACGTRRCSSLAPSASSARPRTG
jgi:hypothetical protein